MPLSGIDQIALQLRVMRPRRLVHVHFMVPVGTESSANVHAQIEAAIKRYCDVRLSNLSIELKARQLTVIRGLQTGVIVSGDFIAAGRRRHPRGRNGGMAADTAFKQH